MGSGLVRVRPREEDPGLRAGGGVAERGEHAEEGEEHARDHLVRVRVRVRGRAGVRVRVRV